MNIGLSQFSLHPIVTDASCLGAQQAGNQIEQGRLARAVLTQQAVDAVCLQAQTEVVEDQVLLTCVLKTDVFNVYHNRII